MRHSAPELRPPDPRPTCAHSGVARHGRCPDCHLRSCLTQVIQRGRFRLRQSNHQKKPGADGRSTAWLTFGIGSAIQWREIRVPIDGPVGDSAVYKNGTDCGKRIRPRQHRPSGRTCRLAIYGSALSAKPLPTSCTTGPIALRFVTSGVSLPPQRTRYTLYDLAIIVNPRQRLR